MAVLGVEGLGGVWTWAAGLGNASPSPSPLPPPPPPIHLPPAGVWTGPANLLPAGEIAIGIFVVGTNKDCICGRNEDGLFVSREWDKQMWVGMGGPDNYWRERASQPGQHK